jgi:phosphotransferase system enzyme I (PtsP)
MRPAPERLSVGAMLEVPSLLWQLPALLKAVDFLSVGSNDLLQFLFAADRGSPGLAGRYDFLSPPVLDLLEAVIRAAGAANVPLSLCGEAAFRDVLSTHRRNGPGASSLREPIAAWAREHGMPI